MVVTRIISPVARTSQWMGVSLVSTIRITLAYKISTKRQWQFETNLESSLEAIRVHSEVLLVGNGPEKSKGLLLGGVKQVGLVVSSALNGSSEFFVRQLDKNLIEGVLEFFMASLSTSGECIGMLSSFAKQISCIRSS
jgi:hypothetical protein